MIEHPTITSVFAQAHYDQLLEEAEIARRIHAFEAGQESNGIVNFLKHWSAELKFWGKPARHVVSGA